MFDSLDDYDTRQGPELSPAISAPSRFIGPLVYGRDPQGDPDDPYECERCGGTGRADDPAARDIGCDGEGVPPCPWCDGYGVYANSDGLPVSERANHPALRRHRRLLGIAHRGTRRAP